MGGDHSLDEFLSRSDTSPEGETDNTTPEQETKSRGIEEENVPEVNEQSTLTVHPARSTMAWTMDHAPCDACGEVVQRRWRDDDQLVCNACKEW